MYLGAISPISVHFSQVTVSDIEPPHSTQIQGLTPLSVNSLLEKSIYQEVRFTLAIPHQINKHKYLMS